MQPTPASFASLVILTSQALPRERKRGVTLPLPRKGGTGTSKPAPRGSTLISRVLGPSVFPGAIPRRQGSGTRAREIQGERHV